jgi:peptidyl-prolyl cis-trans isomerase D
MITWIQRYFHKHFKFVFLLVLAAMAIPLIVIFSPSSGAGRVGGRLNERPFFNVNLGNEEQANRLFADGSLSAELKAGYNALQPAQLQQYSLQRAAGLALADELHLPAPTAGQVSTYVAGLRAFLNESGQFDQKRYAAFGDSLKASKGDGIAAVNRVLRDDVRLEQLRAVISGPGYVLPPDVKQLLISADSTWTVQVASVDYAAFNPAIPAGDDVLKKFYEENSFRYDVPVRPRLSYVEFKGEEFMPPGSPTEADLRAFYNANTASFPVPTDADKKDPTAAPADNFPKVRAQVEAMLKNSVAARIAVKAANDLTVALYEKKLAANSPELGEFLATQHRSALPIPPFAPDAPPANLPWLANYAEQISKLTKERFFTDPLPTGNSFVILLWNDTLPGYKPAFIEVHDRVAADYKDGEKRRLFIEHGRALRAQLQAAAKSGPAAFSTAAAAEKLEVRSYANFTMGKPPQDLPYAALTTLRTLEAGDVSEMVATGDKGLLVYTQEKKVPDLSPGNPRYTELKQQLMTFTASTNHHTFLSELVESELKKTAPAATTR